MTRLRRTRRITPLRVLLALAVVAAMVALVLSQGAVGPDAEGALPGVPRLPREFRGVVRAGGAPAAGARVRLYEDLPNGYATETRAGEDGTFRLVWTPTMAIHLDDLRIAAWDEALRYARTIVAADPEGTVIDLAEPSDVRGRVVDAQGQPVAGARIAAVVRHSFEEAALAVADDDGRFAVPLRAPRGALLDLLVRAPGRAARLERRFRGGDVVTLHVAPGRDAWLRLIDPLGRPVAGARARLAVPMALVPAAPSAVSGPDGRVVIEGASDGSRVAVDVEAEGFLPAEAPAWPGLATDAILWPGREVDVVAWDAWNSRGIEGVEFEADPVPRPGEDWWGKEPGSVGRLVPARPGASGGSYVALLPAGRATLRLTAPGYGGGGAEVPADADRATVRLDPPLSRDRPAALNLRAPSGTPPLDLIIADEEGGGFLRQVTLRDGEADVVVPPGVRLQVASAAASDGVFLPKHVTEALRPGQRRLLRLSTRPAHLLRIRTEPAVDGEALLVATELVRYVPPRRAPVKGGRAEFWVAPLRRLRLAVTVPAGFFPHEAEVETRDEDQDLDLHLRAAVQLRYRLTDRGGNPVPFARALVYEPGFAGQMALEAPPREADSDADGIVRFDALRGGDAAVEANADLFRSRRTIARLKPEGVVDGGTLVLEPAGVIEGTVVDLAGAPLKGVQVRVLASTISWLPLPGGGARELFDLTESSIGDAISDEKGAFSVPDRAPGPPLVAFYPAVASSLSPMAFLPAERYVLAPASYVELEVPGPPAGVYLLVGDRQALLVKTDPPLSLRPLPLLLPSGRSSLYVRLRDGRWGAEEIDLVPGETTGIEPEWRK